MDNDGGCVRGASIGYRLPRTCTKCQGASRPRGGVRAGDEVGKRQGTSGDASGPLPSLGGLAERPRPSIAARSPSVEQKRHVCGERGLRRVTTPLGGGCWSQM